MGGRYCDCFCFECSHIAHSDDNICVSTEEKDDLFKHKLYDIIHYIYSTVCALFTAKFTTCRSTANGNHGVVSHMNELYNINGASITKCSPPYEDVEGHWTNSDSVPQDTVEDSDTYGHSNEEMPVNVDSVIAHEEPHYATCEDVLQQKEVYSKLDRVS